MELHDLKAAWRQQSMESIPDRPNREIVQTIRTRLEDIHRKIRWRDRREIGAAFTGIIIFGAWFFTVPGGVSRTGAAVIVAGSILIIAKIACARSRKSEQRPLLEMREFCANERGRINPQIRLLQSVLWWYIVPNLLGANLFVFGFTGFSFAGIGFLVVSLAFGLILYFVNLRPRAARAHEKRARSLG